MILELTKVFVVYELFKFIFTGWEIDRRKHVEVANKIRRESKGMGYVVKVESDTHDFIYNILNLIYNLYVICLVLSGGLITLCGIVILLLSCLTHFVKDCDMKFKIRLDSVCTIVVLCLLLSVLV